jgi:hypothetical protein
VYKIYIKEKIEFLVMKIRITYYPPFSDVVGKKYEEVTIDKEEISTSELINILSNIHPSVGKLIGGDMGDKLLLNASIVKGYEILQAKDCLKGEVVELKILPPIIGG